MPPAQLREGNKGPPAELKWAPGPTGVGYRHQVRLVKAIKVNYCLLSGH